MPIHKAQALMNQKKNFFKSLMLNPGAVYVSNFTQIHSKNDLWANISLS